MKRVAKLVIVGLVSSIGLLPVHAATPRTQVIKVNGEIVNFSDAQTYVDNGKTMVPVRLLEKLGGVVVWNPQNQTVTVKNSTSEIIMKIGDNTATENIAGKPSTKKNIGTRIHIRNNRVFVPANFLLSDLTDAKIKWVQKGNEIDITKLI